MLFTCPSRYSSTIGHTGVFRLGGWSPRLHARFLGSGVTQELHYNGRAFAYRAVTVSGAPFQGTSARFVRCVCGSYNPGPTRRPVWPVPVSLAATQGISFDFSSCRYLDVSVPGVRLPCGMTRLASCRVAPFGHPGITECVPLPLAYRSLPRPSSPLCAQASPTCLRSLDYMFCRQAEHAHELQSCAAFIGLRSEALPPRRRPMRIHNPTIYLSFTCQTAFAHRVAAPLARRVDREP